MLPYKSLIQLDRASSVSLHIQVCNGFITLISNGSLPPSAMLPSSRVLAELIGIHRNTVKLAYEELISQGWADSVPRKGIFVLSKLPSIVRRRSAVVKDEVRQSESFNWTNRFTGAIPSRNLQTSVLTIDDGFPDVRLTPIDELMREYRSISRKSYGRNFLKYGSSKGSGHLRASIAQYLNHTRGITVSPENVLITKGSQMGIYLASRLLLDNGEHIAVGLSNYLISDNTFLHHGAKLVRIPVDDHGMDADYLEKVLKRKKIKSVYVIPHHHFPTTVTMSMERRLKLLDLARKYRFAIIEDDYDFDFHYENKPYLPLASIDHHQNVIYIGSVTKTVAPALRIGFMIGPAQFINAAGALRELIDKQGDTVLEEAFAVMFDNGEMERYFRKSLKVYKERRNLFCKVLQSDFSDAIKFSVPEGGLAIWARFIKKIDLVKLSQRALKAGLSIDDGTFYRNETFDANGIRMGFASLKEDEILTALGKLRQVI
ncbi:MAG TPA: PLP-dependent aminotransferase family protein [Flavitalea sp.]|nr:PLP-dependent aminotransferase family protein [Flavitalea sp.]